MVSEKRRFIKFVSVWPSDDVDLSLLTGTARGADMEAKAVFPMPTRTPDKRKVVYF